MRNLKRYLATFVVVAMLVSLMMPVTTRAEGTSTDFSWGTEAEDLYAAGLLKGTSDTEMVLALGEKAQRQQAVIMILRFFGVEKTALEMTDEDAQSILEEKFSDAAKVAPYAARQVAYAAENGMFKGSKDGTNPKNIADPLGDVTGKQYIAMILQNLGYGAEFTDFGKGPELLASKGGLDEADIAELGTDSPVTRDLLAGISFSALQAVMKDSGKKVINFLVEDAKTVDAAKAATSLGYQASATATPVAVNTVAPTGAVSEFNVVSATATNGKITAVLNAAPVAAPVGSDFVVTQSIDGATPTSVQATVYNWTITTKTLELQVTPVVPTATLQKIVYKVGYKASTPVATNEVLLISGVNIVSVEALNADGTVATLAGATNVRTDISFKITFSVPIADADVNPTNFQILKTDGSILPLKFSLSDDKKVVSIMPSSSMQALTDYRLVIVNVNAKDGSGKVAGTSTTSFKTGDFVTVTKLTAGGVTVDTAIVKGIFQSNVWNTDILTMYFPVTLTPATATGINVKILEKSGKQVPAVVSYSDTDKTISIQLGQTLGTDDTKRDYSVIATGLKTADGKDVQNYRFDFVVSDDFAPVVLFADGEEVNGDEDVYGRLVTENYAGERKVGFKLNVAFRDGVAAGGTLGEIQEMLASTLTTENVWLAEAATEAKIPTTLSYDAGSRVLSIIPASDLKENTEYRVVILQDVKNILGLKAESVLHATADGGSGQVYGTKNGSTKYQQSFTTGYFVRPVVASTSVVQGAVDVDEDTTNFSIRFDKNLGLTEPATATLISNGAIKLIDNSVNDEEIYLTAGGYNDCTITRNANTLNVTFASDAAAAPKTGKL